MPVSPIVIHSIPFLSSATEAEGGVVATASVLKTFKAGEVLSKAGLVQNAVGFVTSGRLQIREVTDEGRVTRLVIIGPGAVIGWLSLIEDRFMTDEVIAVEEGQLLLCPTQALREIVANSNALLSNLLTMSARAIRSNVIERNMLTLPSAFQRVCFQISNLSNQMNINSADGEAQGGLPKQHDLATAANTTRETVSRTLQILAKAGIITKTGHRVVVRRKDLLQRLATDGIDSLPNHAISSNTAKVV